MMSFSQPFSVISPLLANVDPKARALFENASFLSFLTDSCVVAAIVLGLILWVSRKATTNMQLVPHPAQNFFEFVVEFLYKRIEDIVGPKVAPKAFPLLATLFIFILVSNWFGLHSRRGHDRLGRGPRFRRAD